MFVETIEVIFKEVIVIIAADYKCDIKPPMQSFNTRKKVSFEKLQKLLIPMARRKK